MPLYLSAEVPGHRQEQLTQILIVRLWKRTHRFFLVTKNGSLSLRPTSFTPPLLHFQSYRIVALLNMLTYVFFRILLLGWMTRWLTLHRDDIPLLFFTVGSLGLASIGKLHLSITKQHHFQHFQFQRLLCLLLILFSSACCHSTNCLT